MATVTEDAGDTMTSAEIQATMGSIKKMILVGAVFVVIGYLLLVISGLQEAVTLSTTLSEDSVKMWLKLGGVGHVLVGIFISLVAIIRTLSLVPHRLAAQLN